MSLNSCVLIGRLGKSVEQKTLDSGTVVANFSLAISEKYKGEKTTTWLNITAFNKTAEICSQYLKKGSQVCVQGKIQVRTYEKDGEKKYVTEILANNVVFLDSKNSEPKNETVAAAEKTFGGDKIPF